MIKEERCTFIAIIDTADNVIFSKCCNMLFRVRGVDSESYLYLACFVAYDYGVGEQEVAVYWSYLY